MNLRKSEVFGTNHAGCSFPLNNLPLGVFSRKGKYLSCNVAIGDMILNATRAGGAGLLCEGSPYRSAFEPPLVSMADVDLHMPFVVSEDTNFYAGKQHVVNVNAMFGGPENALPLN